MTTENSLPPLKIKDKTAKICIIQGGMGVGVSLSPLASAVAKEGGIGIVSSAALDRLVTKRTGKAHNTYEACLLYTSPSPRDRTRSRMPSSA